MCTQQRFLDIVSHFLNLNLFLLNFYFLGRGELLKTIKAIFTVLMGTIFVYILLNCNIYFKLFNNGNCVLRIIFFMRHDIDIAK